MTKELIQISASLIDKDFGLEPTDDNDLTENELLKRIQEVVQHLLDKDFNRLLNILYRIDIQEQDVKQILSTTAPDDMSHALSKKILEREYQKAETRLRYSN